MLDRGYFEDLIGQLEPIALAMDRTGDSAHVHLMFRLVHNLKSSVAQEGLPDLATTVHQLEDTLDRIRRGRVVWRSEHCDQVIQVIDRVRQALDGPQLDPEAWNDAPEPPAPLPGPVLEAPLPLPWGLPLDPAQADATELAAALGKGLYRIEKLFRRGLSRETFEGLPVLEDIHELGTMLAQHPSWEAYDQGPEEQVVKFLFASSRSPEQLADIFFDPLITLQAPLAMHPEPRRDGLRFLVIEDDPTVGGLLSYILKQHGSCEVRETGTEGIAHFLQCWERGAPLDLVVLDLFLPDIQGDEVLHVIRFEEAQRGLRPPAHHCLVLMNTASRDLERMKQTLLMEPDGYLLKPINLDLILEVIADLKTRRLGA